MKMKPITIERSKRPDSAIARPYSQFTLLSSLVIFSASVLLGRLLRVRTTIRITNTAIVRRRVMSWDHRRGDILLVFIIEKEIKKIFFLLKIF